MSWNLRHPDWLGLVHSDSIYTRAEHQQLTCWLLISARTPFHMELESQTLLRQSSTAPHVSRTGTTVAAESQCRWAIETVAILLALVRIRVLAVVDVRLQVAEIQVYKEMQPSSGSLSNTSRSRARRALRDPKFMSRCEAPVLQNASLEMDEHADKPSLGTEGSSAAKPCLMSKCRVPVMRQPGSNAAKPKFHEKG